MNGFHFSATTAVQTHALSLSIPSLPPCFEITIVLTWVPTTFAYSLPNIYEIGIKFATEIM